MKQSACTETHEFRKGSRKIRITLSLNAFIACCPCFCKIGVNVNSKKYYGQSETKVFGENVSRILRLPFLNQQIRDVNIIFLKSVIFKFKWELRERFLFCFFVVVFCGRVFCFCFLGNVLIFLLPFVTYLFIFITSISIIVSN